MDYRFSSRSRLLMSPCFIRRLAIDGIQHSAGLARNVRVPSRCRASGVSVVREDRHRSHRTLPTEAIRGVQSESIDSNLAVELFGQNSIEKCGSLAEEFGETLMCSLDMGRQVCCLNLPLTVYTVLKDLNLLRVSSQMNFDRALVVRQMFGLVSIR